MCECGLLPYLKQQSRVLNDILRLPFSARMKERLAELKAVIEDRTNR